MDISVSARKGRWNKGRVASRRLASLSRQKRRKDQEIIYVDKTFLNYGKISFGRYCLHKGFWNEGFDFKRTTSS